MCQCEWQEHESDMQHASPVALCALLQCKMPASRLCSSDSFGCLPAQAFACRALNSARSNHKRHGCASAAGFGDPHGVPALLCPLPRANLSAPAYFNVEPDFAAYAGQAFQAGWQQAVMIGGELLQSGQPNAH